MSDQESTRPLTVQKVATHIRGIKDDAAAAERKEAFEHVNNLILKNASKEESFIKDVKLILKFTKHNAKHARMETNVLQLQLKLKKHLACARISHMAAKESKSVVAVVLGDKLRYPECAVKIEVLRLWFQEKLITDEDVDITLANLDGEDASDSVVKITLFRLLVKHLFPKEQETVVKCLMKHRQVMEKLPKVMFRLVKEDEKEVMISEALKVLWALAKEVSDYNLCCDTLNEHFEILKLHSARKKWQVEARKSLEACVSELQSNEGSPMSDWRYFLMLKHFMDICSLYKLPKPELKAINNLLKFMKSYKEIAKTAIKSQRSKPMDSVASRWCLDHHHDHCKQVQRWLEFIIQFIRHDDQVKFPVTVSEQVWECLVKDPVFPSDQEAGLKWFTKLVKDEQCLKPRSVKNIFINKVVPLDWWTRPSPFCFDCFMSFYDRVNPGSPDSPEPSQWREAITELLEFIDKMGNDKAQPVRYMKNICQPLKDKDRKEIHGFAVKNCLSKLRECTAKKPLNADCADQQHEASEVEGATEKDPEATPVLKKSASKQSYSQEDSKYVEDQSTGGPRRKLCMDVNEVGSGETPHLQTRGVGFIEDSTDQQPEDSEVEGTTEKKTSSLLVSWKTEGSPPQTLQDLRPNIPLEGTSALVHWGDWDCGTDELLERVKPIVRETCTSEFTLTVSPVAFSSNEKLKKSGNAKKLELAKEAFYSLCKNTVVIEMGASCEDYIVMYTGKEFKTLKGIISKRHHHLEEHPMMKDIKALSDMVLGVTCDCGDFESVIFKENVIYVALLYLNDTPAYYVGKAITIEDRWHKSHCQAINRIMRRFERAPGAFEQVIDGQHLCDLVIAGAVLKQVATRSGPGVALFVIDVCPKGNLKCCNPKHQLQVDKKGQQVECKTPKIIDHYEQHYMNAFAELFPDSDTEPKMKCLNVIDSCLCHDCSDGNVRGCSTEVALSVFLHDLQLA